MFVLVAQLYPDSLWPHGLWPTRLLCPWNSPSRNSGVGCHSLLQIFPTQGSNLVSYIAGRFFTVWAMKEVIWWQPWKHYYYKKPISPYPTNFHMWITKLSLMFLSCFVLWIFHNDFLDKQLPPILYII